VSDLDKEIAGKEEIQAREQLLSNKNKESLEISPTGYGYVSVPEPSAQKNHDNL
jgi:hypothetical protein